MTPVLPAILAALGTSAAAVVPTELRVVQLDGVRWNPIGLESQNQLSARWSLWTDAPDGAQLRKGHVDAGVMAFVNPAFPMVGPVVEFKPLAVAVLRVSHQAVWFLGTFDYLQSWPDASDPSVTTAEARASTQAEAAPALGHRVAVEPVLQGKIGPVVGRASGTWERWWMPLHDGDTVFYAGSVDTFIPGQGAVLTVNGDLMWMSGSRWIAGLRYTRVTPLLDAAESGGDPGARGRATHARLGPAVIARIGRERPEDLQLILMTAWYLQHPYRGGWEPYAVGAVRWAWSRPWAP